VSGLAGYLSSPLDEASLPLESIFAEEPVPLTTFVQDRKFLGNPPLSPIQYQAVRHIEQIYFPETYKLMAQQFGEYWEPVRPINFATLQWGKGSGKDHICRVSSLRIAYLLICLKSPQEYFGIAPQDTIHMLNVASSRLQANNAFFTPLVKAVQRGWFADHAHDKQDVIIWSKNIESISGHADAESQEGMNLILGIADEIDAFRSKEELLSYRAKQAREPTRSAEAILKMLRTSASTRFPQTFKIVQISYPRYLGSTIQQLTRRAKQDFKEKGPRSRYYVDGPRATWDVRPGLTKENFAEDYVEDEIMARSMYECKPARAVDAYFRNLDALHACVRDEESPIKVDYKLEKERGSKVWVPRYHFDPGFYPIKGASYVIHADMAVKNDRAGVAMSHVVRWDTQEFTSHDEEGGEERWHDQRPFVKCDFIFSFQADLNDKPPREIQIRWVRQLVFELLRQGFPIARVTFDQFESRDSMQIIESKGVETERVSLDRDETAWRTLRDLMYEVRLSMPMSKILIEDELPSLQKLSNGKIDHPPMGSKDEADALAGSVMGAIEIGGAEDPDGQRAYFGSDRFGGALGPGGKLFNQPRSHRYDEPVVSDTVGYSVSWWGDG